MQNKSFNNKDYYFVIINTRNQAIALYYSMERRALPFYQLISTPCHIRAGCNYAIKFNTLKHYQILKKEAALHKVQLGELYHFHYVKGKRVYDKVSN